MRVNLVVFIFFQAAHFSRSDVALFGFAEYFKKASSQEHDHAHELTELATKRFAPLNFKNINAGNERKFTSSVEAFKAALKKEMDVANSFQILYQQAIEDKDVHVSNWINFTQIIHNGHCLSIILWYFRFKID